MDKVWLKLQLVLVAMLLVPAPSYCSIPSSKAALIPQRIGFTDSTISLHSIGQLTHKFSLRPPEYPTASECYTHRTEAMEQVLCWSEIEPGFEPNLAGAFVGVLHSYGGENLLGPSAFIAYPRNVSEFTAIEFEAYLREPSRVTTIRSLFFATSGNVWHVTLIFATGNPTAEATVEAVFSSVKLEGESGPIKVHGYLPEEPLPIPRGIERLLIQVTSGGDIYLNGKEASLDDVGQELERLGEGDGIVLYNRAGGDSPPPEAESVSAAILFAVGMAGVEMQWLEIPEE